MSRSRRRLLSAYPVGSASVRVYRDPEWDVWVVVTVNHWGKRTECEETDRDAAEHTAKALVHWLQAARVTAKPVSSAPNAPILPQEGTEASDRSGLAPQGSEGTESKPEGSSSKGGR